ASGGPGGLNYYYWDFTFPADRSGYHIVFIHWVRSDSPENFYSCSDVVFDGGNGEVTGIGGDPGPTQTPIPDVCPDTPAGPPGRHPRPGDHLRYLPDRRGRHVGRLQWLRDRVRAGGHPEWW